VKRQNKSEDSSDDLIQKVKTVESVIGYRILYHSPSAYNKKTVEKWLRGDASPRKSSLQEFCQCAGITLAEFEAPFGEFAETLAAISERLHKKGMLPQCFSCEQVHHVIESFRKGGGVMSVLSETVDAIGRKTMTKYFREFQGYYFGYLRWTHWEQKADGNASLNGAAFRCLIHLESPDPDHHVIRARLTTFSHLKKYGHEEDRKWAYDGIMIPIPGKLIFMLEAPNPSFEDMGFVFIMVQTGAREHLPGILFSDSSVPEAPLMKVQPVPAASRILLRKASNDLSEEQLMSMLDHQNPIEAEILNIIENEIHPDAGILMTRF